MRQPPRTLHLLALCAIVTGCGSGGGTNGNVGAGPAPAISDPRVDWHFDGTATVSWATDLPATSRVEYGTTAARTDSVDAGAALATSHAIELAGLAAETSYQYRIRSASATGAERTFDGSFFTDAQGGGGTGPATITGTLVAWHPVTLSFQGPTATELDDEPNPFLDYRLTVTLSGPSGQVLRVPGFFDGDGQGGGTGDVWRVRFAADEGGTWSYEAQFVEGLEVAIDLDPNAGTATAFDGASGTFRVAPRDPDAPGFYRHGELEYVGDHYPKFRDGPHFIKGGTDSPENFLGYRGFDNTIDQGGASTAGLVDGLHGYPSHMADFGSAGLGTDDDPVFESADSGYDSRGIVGALNYLASVGVNSVYFLPMNLGGDGRETAPFVGYAGTRYDTTHYDVSKLTQWNAVFEHAQRRGILLHFVLGETEAANERWLDGGELGVERKLFYREMVARFGHALAIKWNLCEESDFTFDQHVAFAGYIRAVDPYEHPIGFHTRILPADGRYTRYDDILGDARFETTSIQGDPEDAGAHVERWRAASAAAGRKWIVETDEQTPAGTGLTDTNAEYLRKETLYDVLFSGGHIEWYAGYHALPLGGDLRLEDFRTREAMWVWMRHARMFMQDNLPFWEMEPADQLVTGEASAFGGAEVFAKAGDTYAVYYPDASSTGALDLTGAGGSFTARWFDPRIGAFAGTARAVTGGGPWNVGAPPGGQQVDVFQERDGLLVIECEAVPPANGWIAESALSGFAGASYYRWNGGNQFNRPGNGVLRYHFEVGNPGDFQFAIHNRHEHAQPDQENDCWVRVDGGNWIKVFSNRGASTVRTWNWDSQFDPPRAPAHYQLTAGRHTIEISGRSQNFRIDRMHFYLGNVSNPLSLGKPQSSSVRGSAGTSDDWVLLLTR